MEGHPGTCTPFCFRHIAIVEPIAPRTHAVIVSHYLLYNTVSEDYGTVSINQNIHQVVFLVHWTPEQPCRYLLPTACYLTIKIVVCAPHPGLLQSITSLGINIADGRHIPARFLTLCFRMTSLTTLKLPGSQQRKKTVQPQTLSVQDLIKRSHPSSVQFSGEDVETWKPWT